MAKMTISEIERLARSLMERHLDMKGKHRNWRFLFDSSPGYDGVCHYTINCITMPHSVADRGEFMEVKSILLHEIAHALNPGDAHGPTWNKTLIDLIKEHAFGR